MKHNSILMALLLLTACQPSLRPDYQSVDEYPVKQTSANEMQYSPKSTQFSVWAPAADSVRLSLYESGANCDAYRSLMLHYHKDGSWTGSVKGDLKGHFYTFAIYQDGHWYDETPGIFAKAVGINGKRAAIIDMQETDPEGWNDDVRPEYGTQQDAIVYEMHWRDISQHAAGRFAHPGKYLALTEEGVTTEDGMAVGIDHLKELGITHVHILPSYDFGSIDETGAGSEARVLESGAAVGGSYNWGYDPVNYNVPEGSYSTNPYEPAVRIREFKQMVQALHKAGIRVILDVVYNHTYNVESSAFTLTAPGYFYRTQEDGSLGNASGCGNETASDRPMMRKFMIESTQYWLSEYHLDGLRFDLMGIHDIETMNQIRAMADQIDPTIIIYGEGWACNTVQIPEDQLAMKANVHQLNRIAAFSDDMRDALRGPFWDDHQGAFLIGLPGNEERIRFGLVGSIEHPDVDMAKVNDTHKAWAAQPYQTMAYVSCHDDMCLVDRLHATLSTKDETEYARLDKLAQTAVLTSQGVPFIFCGEEVMRDKKGVHNSFCSPDEINAIDWSLKAQHKDVFDYYAGLIKIRRAHKVFRMGDADLVRQHMHFLPVESDCVIAYQLDGNAVEDTWGTVIVVLNARKEAVQINVPEGQYRIVVADGVADIDGLSGIQGSEVSVAPQSALIMHTL